MISREQVVRDIVAGIERRADTIAVPKVNTSVAWAPGIFRRIVEFAAFRSGNIERAISLASATGWNHPVARMESERQPPVAVNPCVDRVDQTAGGNEPDRVR
ncbi:hypothetical protein [Burkholderia gladioli]|uniref:hypothetical protein n=1 Tax=Burkholderia gladioli TaxID=28095 RepID=UPI002FE022B4